MHGRTTVAAVLVMAMLGTSLAETGRAQEPPGATVASALTEGARVRVLWSTVNARVSGGVVGVDGTDVTIAPDGGLPLKIPRRSITKMDVSLGATRNTLKGLAIGVLIGIAMGLPGIAQKRSWEHRNTLRRQTRSRQRGASVWNCSGNRSVQ